MEVKRHIYTTCTYDTNGERLMRYNQTHYYYYYYDGVNLLFVKKDNAIDMRYLYDNEGNVYCAIASDNLPYWHHTDIRGSVTNVLKGDSGTSSSPTLIRSYLYNAYGDTNYTTFSGGETFNVNPYLAYTGAILDQETGLYYLMSRYYDPKAGSFISQDSYKGEGDAFWHLYAYCDGDPVNKTDRNGNYSSGVTWSLKNKTLSVNVRYYLLLDRYYRNASQQQGFRRFFKSVITTALQSWNGKISGNSKANRLKINVSNSYTQNGSLRIHGIKGDHKCNAFRIGYKKSGKLPLNTFHMNIYYLTTVSVAFRTYAKVRRSVNKLTLSIAHEFGHILGLSDAYKNNKKGFSYQAVDKSAMLGSYLPSANDRKLVLQSYLQGQKFKGGYN